MRLLGHAMARPGVGVVTSPELAAVQLLRLHPYLFPCDSNPNPNPNPYLTPTLT